MCTEGVSEGDPPRGCSPTISSSCQRAWSLRLRQPAASPARVRDIWRGRAAATTTRPPNARVGARAASWDRLRTANRPRAGGRPPTGPSRRKTDYSLSLTRARERARGVMLLPAACRLEGAGEPGCRRPPPSGPRREAWRRARPMGNRRRPVLTLRHPGASRGVYARRGPTGGGRIPLLARAYEIYRAAAAVAGAGSSVPA